MNTTFDGLSQVKSFDVIFIGHLASVTAYLFANATKDQYKSLVLSNSQMQNRHIKVNNRAFLAAYSVLKHKHYQKNKKKSVYHKQLKIININPIAKQGGKIYDYKYLVYSGNLQDWIDFQSIKTLQQALSNEYSFVYSNIKKRDLTNMYKQASGNIIFYLPNDKPSAYDNINFLWIYQNCMKTINSDQKQGKQIHFKIILQGTQFFPYCKQADQLLKKQIHERGIDIIYNSKLIKIDYLRRSLTLNQTSEISYNAIYCIVPQRIPLLLKSADIEPSYSNPKTLLNKRFKNIFVFGADILPTTHTFEAVQYQSRIICSNLQHLLTKSGHIALYNGRTMIPLYLTCKQITDIVHFYQKSQCTEIQKNKTSVLTENCSLLTFYISRMTKPYLAECYYNYSSWGSPYYIFSPSLSSVRYIQEQKFDKYSALCGNNRACERQQQQIQPNQTAQVKPKAGRSAK